MKTWFSLFAALILTACETPPHPAAPPPKESLLDLVENQNLDKIRDIFGLNQDVDSVNEQGQTALHIAASKDLADIAAVLLARGAQVDLVDRQGNTPLHLAVKNGSTQVLSVLAQYGASLFSKDGQGRSVLQTALQQNPEMIPRLVTKNTLASRDDLGNTVLHVAAAQGLEGLVDILLRLGADQQVRNKAQLTALDEALLFPQSYTHAKIAWKLARQGAPQPRAKETLYFWQGAIADNPSLVVESGQSLLHYAASRGQTGMLRLLVSLGANINAVDQPGNTPLHRAAENGDLEAAGILLDQGAEINAKDFNNNTTLHLALTSRNALETTTFLLSKGALPSAKNNSGNTPLHMVVSLGLAPEVAQALINKGADLNARNKLGNTPLLDATKESSRALIAVLLQMGANPFAVNNEDQSPVTVAIKSGVETLGWLFSSSNVGLRDDNGNTALHIAVQTGNYPAAVAYLLSAGSNANDRNKKGQSPLHLAIEQKNLLVAQLLLKAKADLFLLDNSGISPLTQVFSSPVAFSDAFFTEEIVDLRDSNKNTPLAHAVVQGNLAMVQLLTRKGASVRTQNLAGLTPLHEAVRLGNAPLAALLLKAGAQVGAVDARGNTPLHGLVQFDSIELGELLLANGADVAAKNGEGRTVLQEAIRRGLGKVSAWLLKKGADPNTRDALGRTPLFDAIQTSQPELVRLLIDNGGAVNSRDASGSTPAHAAASATNRAILELLLKSGADVFAENAVGLTPVVVALRSSPESWKVFFTAKNVNNQNNQGLTALHLAAAGAVSVEAVQYLLSLGADIQSRNKDGKTPGDLARTAGRTDLVELLKQK